MKKIIIIGAGISGLATAALLAQKGYNVQVLEKNDTPGGRAMLYQENGFRFDMGPSWYHMPEIFEHYFSLFGKHSSDFYQLQRLDPQYKVFFPDEDVFEIAANLEKNIEFFESREQGIRSRMMKYLAIGKSQYEAIYNGILFTSFDTWKNLISSPVRIHGPQLNVLQSFNSLLDTYFTDEKIKTLLKIPAIFIGQNPQTAPAFFSFFSHIDLSIGVHYPMGGIYKIIESLLTLCKTYGVEILCNHEVTHIETSHKRAHRVITKQKNFDADIVVSNADYAHTETSLLSSADQTYPQSYWDKKTFAPSAFIMYLGIKKRIPSLFHHNYILPSHFDRTIDQQMNGTTLPEDPLIYLSCPSKTDTSVAPEGCENIFVTVAIPPDIRLSQADKEAYASVLIKRIETFTKCSFEQDIDVKKIFTVDDFKQTFNAWKGTTIGLAQSLTQSTIFLPKHKSQKIDNLYFTGQYTHPGIGMPMCMVSAQLVVERICHEQ